MNIQRVGGTRSDARPLLVVNPFPEGDECLAGLEGDYCANSGDYVSRLDAELEKRGDVFVFSSKVEDLPVKGRHYFMPCSNGQPLSCYGNIARFLKANGLTEKGFFGRRVDVAGGLRREVEKVVSGLKKEGIRLNVLDGIVYNSF